MSDWSVIVVYANLYDSAGRLTQVTESPSGAVTTYQYDGAGRILSENRVNERPYSGVYTYESRRLRATAIRDENGVVSHSGTYSTFESVKLKGRRAGFIGMGLIEKALVKSQASGTWKRRTAAVAQCGRGAQVSVPGPHPAMESAASPQAANDDIKRRVRFCPQFGQAFPSRGALKDCRRVNRFPQSGHVYS